MQKDEFIRRLDASLSSLPQDDRNDIIADYQEHFSIGALNRRTEEEIAVALGDPVNLGREYTALALVKKAEESPSARGMGMAILSTLGLGILSLVVVLLPSLLLMVFLFIILVMGLSLLFSGTLLTGCGLLCLIGVIPAQIPISAYAAVFFGIGTTSAGLLLILGDFWLGRLFYRLGIRYLKWNIAVIHGSEHL